MDPAVTVIGRLRFLLLKEEIRVEFYYWRRSVLDVLLVRVVVGVLLYCGLLWFFFFRFGFVVRKFDMINCVAL